MERHDEHDDLERIAPTLHGLRKSDPFVVPEGFFERFPHEVQAAIVAREQRTVWQNLPALVRQLAVALPVCALLAGAWWYARTSDAPVAADLSSTPSLDDLSWTEEHELLASIEAEGLSDLEGASVDLTDEELAAYFDHQDIDLTELITEQ